MVPPLLVAGAFRSTNIVTLSSFPVAQKRRMSFQITLLH